MYSTVHKALDYVRFLTFVVLSLIFLANQVKADLAPREFDDEVERNNNIKAEIHEENHQSTTQAPTTNLGFIHAFVASFSVIIVSEIGDKTFFIAAIMSMKYPRLAVFTGAIAALALMTVLSAAFGTVFIKFIPPAVTRWVSVGLFVVFGLKMLHEGYNMTATDAAEEMEGVQADLRRREEEIILKPMRLEPQMSQVDVTNAHESHVVTSRLTNQMLNRDRGSQVDAESGSSRKIKNSAFMFLFRIFIQAFTMTFVAEWGDRSQITTIVLAARENLLGVITGGTIGHAICTGIGVIGGRIIAQKISVKTVTLVGGIVFIIFAITSSIWDPTSDTSTLKEGN